ncbi:MAG: aminotransferase class IV [Flavobacteriaceae bacterium]
MYPLFESLCVLDGQLLNAQWHEDRFQKAYLHRYGRPTPFDLLQGLSIPAKFAQGKVKLRIRYNHQDRNFHFEHYQIQKIQSLRLVYTEELDYSYKYSKREKLEGLFAQRGGCDDVLIVRKGRITDSSYANVVFFDGQDWWTPKDPLLKGTCRARLLDQGSIKEAAMEVEDLKNFKGLKLINALRDLDQPMIPINRLMY